MRRRLTFAALVALLTITGSAIPAQGRRPPLFRIFEPEGPSGEPVGFQVRPHHEGTSLGETATWRNRGELPHSLVDRSGLFAWGPIAAGDELSFRPGAAGSYRFSDAAAPDGDSSGTWETGELSVSPIARWLRSAEKPTYRVRWASRPAPDGLLYDVQVPASPDGDFNRWAWWIRGSEEPAGRYEFRWRYGCFGFRPRLREAGHPRHRLGWGYGGLGCLVS